MHHSRRTARQNKNLTCPPSLISDTATVATAVTLVGLIYLLVLSFVQVSAVSVGGVTRSADHPSSRPWPITPPEASSALICEIKTTL